MHTPMRPRCISPWIAQFMRLAHSLEAMVQGEQRRVVPEW
jgi:hypothetical protein